MAVLLSLAAGAATRADEPPPAAEAAAKDRVANDPLVENAPAKATDPAEKRAAVGRLIRIPLPITGNVDTQVKTAVQRVLTELPPGGPRPVLVFEFVAQQNKFGEGSDFGRALVLARYLSSRDLSAAKTVAFVPHAIKGHAVLVAMACEEIVMAPEAEIGDAGVDEPHDEAIDPTVRSGYREIANRRRTIPAEVALGMLDKQLEVLRVETDLSPEYVFRTDLDELRKRRAIQSEKVIIRAGEMGRFSGRQARELGLAKYLAADRAALAKALSLPVADLDEDPSLDGGWRPIRVAIKGPITDEVVKRVQRSIEDQVREQNINFVCLSIDSGGGSLEASINLANFLAELDPGHVRTVAYVQHQARGDAALIAIACDQLVMHREALLGGSGEQAFTADDVRPAVETLKQNISPKKSRPWSLPAAMIDGDLKVFRYKHRNTGLPEYFCEDEAKELPDADAWIQQEEITRKGEPLRLTGERAHDLNLAKSTVHDFGEFKKLYGLENDVTLVEPGWADALIVALRSDGVALLLLLIGFAALYAELQAPGIGVGGFLAGVCFLLFFWSKYLEGTAGWLEVLLFLAGVSCILLEIFVLPGAAIFALGGGLLIISSLVLASQTFVLPRNDYQLTELRNSLLALCGVGVGVIVAALLLRRYLPHTPMFSHMVLEPPSSEELEDLSHRESLVEFDYLLGQQGLTTTQLTPSGKARFGHQLLDVIADGELIGRGAPVIVTQVQGNRVVVRSADAG